MKCAVCNEEMFRTGIQRVLNAQIVADFECPSCHQRMQAPVKRE